MTVAPLPHILTVPGYPAGRKPENIKAELGLSGALQLASNESPYQPLPSVKAVLQQHTSVNRYPPVRARALIERLAIYNDLTPDVISVGPGSAGLLWQIARAFLSPTSEVVAPHPSFPGYRLAAQLSGAKFVEAPLVNHLVSVPDLVAKITDNTDLVVVAQPNNPTGTALEHSDLEALVAATRNRSLLVLDEAYLEFSAKPPATTEFLKSNDHVVILRTFSKAYGLAGLRVGYALGSKETVSHIDRVSPPFSVSALAQDAAIASLDARHELQVRIDETIRERQHIIERLRHDGWDIPDSSTNFIWLPVREQTQDLATSLEQHGVITRPIHPLGLRVTVGTPDENDAFLRALSNPLPPLRKDTP